MPKHITINDNGFVKNFIGLQADDVPLIYNKNNMALNEFTIITLTNNTTSAYVLNQIPDFFQPNNTSLTSLIIGNSVTSIGNYAFANCAGITGQLNIPNSVTSIGGYAFNDCSNLTGSLTIPDSVTLIGQYAFTGCSSLQDIYVNAPASIWGPFSLNNTGSGPIYVTLAHINSYGGAGASFFDHTVTLW